MGGRVPNKGILGKALKDFCRCWCSCLLLFLSLSLSLFLLLFLFLLLLLSFDILRVIIPPPIWCTLPDDWPLTQFPSQPKRKSRYLSIINSQKLPSTSSLWRKKGRLRGWMSKRIQLPSSPCEVQRVKCSNKTQPTHVSSTVKDVVSQYSCRRTDKTRYFVSSSSTPFLFKFSATSVGSKLYRPTATYCYVFSSHLRLSSWVPLQIQPSGTCDPRWFGRSYPKGQQMSWWLPRSWIQNRDRDNSPNFGEMTHHKPSQAPNPWHFIGSIGPSRERPGFIFQRWPSWSNPYVRLVTCLSARRIRGLKEFQEIQSPKLNIILHLYFWGCEESSSLGHKIAEVFWDQKSVMLFFQVQNAGPFWEQLLKVIFEKHPFYPPKFGNENNIRTSFHRFSPTFPHYSFLVYYICWYDPTPPPTRGS